MRPLNLCQVTWRTRRVAPCRKRRMRINPKPWYGWGCWKTTWQHHLCSASTSLSRTFLWQIRSGKSQGGCRDMFCQCWVRTSPQGLTKPHEDQQKVGNKAVRLLLGMLLWTTRDFSMQSGTQTKQNKTEGISSQVSTIRKSPETKGTHVWNWCQCLFCHLPVLCSKKQ